MSAELLAGGAVLVDDVLLDPTAETLAAAAFGGPPLHRARTVLYTGPSLRHVPGDRDGVHRGATWTARRLGDGWLLDTTTEGLLLHCPRGSAEVPAGAVLTVRGRLDGPLLRSNRRVLVTGGTRSGKSVLAEEIVGDGAAVYVATGPQPGADGAWARRIAAHRARRPQAWRTVETLDVATLLGSDGDPVLVDGLGTWTSGVLDETGWESPGGLHARQDRLVAAFARTLRTAVLVTDEVGDGVVPEHASGRTFRDELGALNARLAARADEVWRATAGIATRIR